mgnify:CR=1 FL=1
MRSLRWMSGVAVSLLVASCASLPTAPPVPLRVGVTLNYQPLIFRLGDITAGVENDFAAELAKELGRPLQLITVPWELQIDELIAGRTDIVMSGLTITPERRARAAFCDSYMDNPLMAVVRRGETGRYPTVAAIKEMTGTIGVLPDTTADAFVRQHCPRAKIMSISSTEDVAFYLPNQRIDLYLDDMAAVVDLALRYETRLELLRFQLAPQQMAWAVRADNVELRHQANQALARWRADGELDRILNRWMPYRFTLAKELGW